MNRGCLLALVAMFTLLDLSWHPVLHGNTRSTGVSEKGAVGTQAPDAKAKADPALTYMTGISIRTIDDGRKTAVDVSASHPGPYRVLRLEKPNRLVLDLEGARNVTHRWKYSSDSPLLAGVCVGRFSPRHGGVIRIVADLDGNPACHVERQPSGLRIELIPRSGGGSDGEESIDTARDSQPKEPASEQGPPITQNVAEAVAHEHAGQTDKTNVAHGTRTGVLQRDPASSSASDSSSVRNPSPLDIGPNPWRKSGAPKDAEAPKATKVITELKETVLHPVAAPTATGGEQGTGSKYTGKRISLDLKGVDLKDFFRLIHEVSGLNIIVDPDVSGSVTVVLDDVPWDQALALVLNNNSLGDRLEGNVLRIAKISTLTREQEEQQKLNIAREDSAPLATVFRRLNYAKAATIAALLKTWSGGGALSRRGSVLVDERTNTLIISDIASRIPRIESDIRKLDKKAQQVSIQARIIRATSDFARNLSTALSFAQRNPSGSLTTGGATGNPVSGQPLSPPTVTTSPATGFGVFVLSNLGRNYAINAAIAAAETHDQAKTISQPSIVTQNNVEGTVIQGTQIPIQTTINNTISVQYVQASLQLKVTPQVTQDGNVFLTIDVQNSSPGPALTLAGPTINTQSATTQVLVPNGGTVVFGGVTVHTKSGSSTGIPWLEDIPLFGHLFKSTTTQRNDQELLFFVTPKILT